jgi:hypothetical protein
MHDDTLLNCHQVLWVLGPSKVAVLGARVGSLTKSRTFMAWGGLWAMIRVRNNTPSRSVCVYYRFIYITTRRGYCQSLLHPSAAS